MTRVLMTAALMLGFGCNSESPPPKTPPPARAAQPMQTPPSSKSPPPTAPKDSKAWPAGNLQPPAIKLRFGVYGFDPPTVTTSLGEVLDDHKATLKPLPPGDKSTAARTVGGNVLPVADFPPPSTEEIFGFNLGQGLSPEGAKRLQKATTLAVLEFNADPDSLAAVHREALAMVAELAERTEGVPYDDATSQVFSREAWAARAARDPADSESMLAHFQVHGVPDGSHTRLVTAGLAKFGLPDLVVESVQGTLTTSMVGYVNDIAKALHASPTLARDGVIELGDGAEVRLDRAQPRFPYDPNNRLAEVVFEGDGSLNERHNRVLEARYGRQTASTTFHATNDPELEAIAARARGELESLLPKFASGPPRASEVLLVKAPFAVPPPKGGRELMWIEVTGWDGTTVRGILQNQPNDIQTVKRGDEVEVPFISLADYVHRRADGTQVGGESQAVLEKRR